MSDQRIPSPGDVVLYRVGGTSEYPVLRPAIVVAGYGPDCASVHVLLDPNNDQRHAVGDTPLFSEAELARGTAWRSSVLRNDSPCGWRWTTR